MYHPFVEGEKIYLRGLEKNDLGGNMFQWANDSEVTHYMFFGAVPNTMEKLEEEYEQLTKNTEDVVFAIVDKKSDAHIGNVGIYAINFVSRSGEFRIIIGEKEYWNKVYGTEATKLAVDYSFEKLNLNCVYLGVNADHQSAIKAYENAGFVKEGTMRQVIYRNGRYYDAIRMSILREEYYSCKGKG
ncbi:GNAT family N-acetyltransferase [Chloroflexota bacterium]